MGAELHVAAMPFPMRQGTQAAVQAMWEALVDQGRDAHLLTYGSGLTIEEDRVRPELRSRLHQGLAWPGEAFRSGPSARKLVEDAFLAGALARLASRLEPDAVVAHHVEAAMACLAARARPLVFYAHTALGPELPSYAPRVLRGLVARAGEGLDAALAHRADAVCAVSPALATTLERDTGREVSYVPIPWRVPPPATADERADGRREMGLPDAGDVLLYAGNLDAYQGWELLVATVAIVARAHDRVWLVVATGSDSEPLLREAARAGVEQRVRVVALGDEASRRSLHAAADAVVVPRKGPGGLPVKLLDALARGVPTIACARAAAGLDLNGSAFLVRDDDAEAMASAIRLVLGARDAARESGARGRAFVEREHAPARFVEVLDRVTTRASLARSQST